MNFNSMFETLIPFIPVGNAVNTMIKKQKNKDNKNESFENSTIYSLISSLIGLVVFCFAIYLSWRCNNKEFNFVGFLGAFCCSPCYIIYQFFNNQFCGLLAKKV